MSHSDCSNVCLSTAAKANFINLKTERGELSKLGVALVIPELVLATLELDLVPRKWLFVLVESPLTPLRSTQAAEQLLLALLRIDADGTRVKSNIVRIKDL